MRMKKRFKKNYLPFLIIALIVMMAAGTYLILLPRIYPRPNNAFIKKTPFSNIETIDIISERYMFSPMLISLKKGKAVKLTLKTNDVQHGIELSELGISLLAYPGRPAETTITPEKIGEFTTNCSLYCGSEHNIMKLTFRVNE